MASDYKKIAKEHEKRYGWDAKPRRIYKRLYSDKTHFVYELIQNADDSKSQHLELQLDSNTLFVWNDGRQFNERDVRSICSLGSSDKDLTHIGTFGIGFKAVYNYTEFPEIYSDDERFRIRDFIKPEGIDEMTPEIAKLVSEGKTVFCLPFKDSLYQDDIDHLKNRLCNLAKERVLLSLRHFERVEWKDEHNAQTGSYSCHRYLYDKIQNIPENECVKLVELTGTLNGKNKPSETFLVFRKKIHPPKDIIDKLLEQAEDEEEQQGIQQSAGELQPVEVAFKLQDDRITAMDDNSVLFACFPTEKETHLKFLIQARYQTTPARDNIPKPSENPWNRWLVKKTADFLPEILEQLKAGELLEPAFFKVIPLKDDPVPEAFMPISEILQKAMRDCSLIPTEDGGYAKADSVFYPHRESLRGLIDSNWLYPNSSWLHHEIGDTEEFRRCFKVMREAGVKEIGVSQVLDWLEKQDCNWFEDRSGKWLCSLYVYLNSQKSELERIKKLPLVRLENGQHVCATDQLVFFPPDADEAREEIKPFINDLPILQSVFLGGEDCNDIEAFLKSIGVRRLRRVDMILEGILPQYHESAKPSAEENRLHVRYLFKVWNDVSESERSRLKEKISEIPILRAYKGIQREAFDFVIPCDAYLPKAYTGDADLETYFSVYDGDIWFIDDAYLEDNSDTKVWFQFLKVIGTMNTPRITVERGSAEEWDITLFKREVDRIGEDTYEQPQFEGVFRLLYEESEVSFSRSLWNLLVKSVPSEKSKRNAFFQGTYHWHYYKPRFKLFDSFFFIILTQEGEWLSDEQGNLHVPSECFAPTPENRRVLGDSVTYLSSNFDISTEPAQWLAESLGIQLKADSESVLNYLQKLRSDKEVSIKKVEPLYRFLLPEVVNAQLRGKFKKEPLIFTPNPEPRWWRTDEVFWEDESGVFKNDRGCLKAHYPEILKPFFTALGVSEQASQLDYARGIQEFAATEQAEDQKVRERVQRLYKCLKTWQANKWEIIYDSRCWLGKKGEEWGFFTRQKLVLKDHPHIGEIFEGEVPFWTFDDDLSNLASKLKVEECSQAKVEFHPEGDQEEDTDWSEKVRDLRPYIHAFLDSPRLYEEPDIFMDEEPEEEKLAEILDQLSVCRVKKLKVTYKLKGISVTDRNPRPSFLDVIDQQATLWLGLEEKEDEYAELIGDALQDYFGVKELGRFVENLLTRDRDRVLSSVMSILF